METPKIKELHYLAYLCGALLMFYFLFPHLLLMPWVLAGGRKHPLPDWAETLFWPVSELSLHVPLYRELLEAESDLTGID